MSKESFLKEVGLGSREVVSSSPEVVELTVTGWWWRCGWRQVTQGSYLLNNRASAVTSSKSQEKAAGWFPEPLRDQGSVKSNRILSVRGTNIPRQS